MAYLNNLIKIGRTDFETLASGSSITVDNGLADGTYNYDTSAVYLVENTDNVVTTGTKSVTINGNTLTFGSNAFTSTTIPSTTSNVTSGSSAALTSGGAYTALSNYLKLDGTTTMTGKLQLLAGGGNDSGNIGSNGICWDSNSMPQDTGPQYFCTIDAFAAGGRQKWANISDVKNALSVPTVTNYYWADLNLSASGNGNTEPSFKSITLNGQSNNAAKYKISTDSTSASSSSTYTVTLPHSSGQVALTSDITTAETNTIAPAFVVTSSNHTSYAVGSFVIKDGLLYKCTTATTSASWVSGSWTAVKLGSELEYTVHRTGDELISGNKTFLNSIIASGLSGRPSIRLGSSTGGLITALSDCPGTSISLEAEYISIGSNTNTTSVSLNASSLGLRGTISTLTAVGIPGDPLTTKWEKDNVLKTWYHDGYEAVTASFGVKLPDTTSYTAHKTLATAEDTLERMVYEVDSITRPTNSSNYVVYHITSPSITSYSNGLTVRVHKGLRSANANDSDGAVKLLQINSLDPIAIFWRYNQMATWNNFDNVNMTLTYSSTARSDSGNYYGYTGTAGFILDFTYDSGNDTYNLYDFSAYTVGSTALSTYSLTGFDVDGKRISIVNADGTLANVPFVYGRGIFYYDGSARTANTSYNTWNGNFFSNAVQRAISNTFITQNNLNTVTRTTRLYLKGSMSGITMTPVALTTTLPSTEDGYYYMLLGKPYQDYTNSTGTQYWCFNEHPIYVYRNGGLVQVVNSETGGGVENIEDGTGTNALQQKQDGSGGTFSFTNKNPNATALDNTLTGNITFGGVGNYATSLGGKSQASGKRSVAQGTTTVAKGNYSHAEGDNSVSLGADSHAEGYQTVSYGGASHAEGTVTQAIGNNSHAEGNSTIARAVNSHAEGYNSQTLISSSSKPTIPAYSDQAGGGGSNPGEGGTSIAQTGDGAHVEGSDTRAVGNYSHAEGTSTWAGGLSSHAEGYGSQALYDYAHAEGYNSVASGYGAHATGLHTTASGNYSFTQGQQTEAGYNLSSAFGKGTQTHFEAETVVGKYSSQYYKTNGTPLFTVGNGTADNARDNAFVVYDDGSAEVSAVGSTGDSVVNKDYVDNNCLLKSGALIASQKTFSNGSFTMSTSQLTNFTNGLYFFTYGNTQTFGYITTAMLAASGTSPIRLPIAVIYSSSGYTQPGFLRIQMESSTSVRFTVANENHTVVDGFKMSIYRILGDLSIS